MTARRVLALALAVALGTAACGGQGGAPGPATDEQPRTGGELRFATDADPGCLDPHQSPTAASQLVSRGVVDSLVAQDPQTLTIRPWLAESWQVTPDATGFTFVLRDGITFSDGTPLTADAVKANFDRIVDPATKSLLAASLMAGYTGTTVVNPKTVTVAFSAPNASFLQAASTAFLGMQSPAAFAGGPQALCQKPVGSGPFVVSERVANQKITLARRDGYHWGSEAAKHRGTAYLDAVRIDVVPENGVRMGSLRSHQVDAIANVPPKEADGLKAEFQLLTKQQPGIAYSLNLNGSRAPLTEVPLRQAIAKAVDTEQIVNTLYQGKYPRATSVLTSATPGHAPVLGAGQFDPAAAERLLDQAGWLKNGTDGTGVRSKAGQRLSLEWVYVSPAREQRDLLAQLVQQQLGAVGVEVKLTPLPLGEVLGRSARGDWQLSDISFVRADGDVLRTVLTAPRGGTPAAVVPEVPALLSEAAATVDEAKRAANYERVQRLIVEGATAVPVYDPTYLLAADGAVHGLSFDPQGLPSFHETWVVR